MLSLERLKQRVSYNPETGVLVWRETLSGMCREGWPAGRLGTGKAAGYVRVTIDNREYKAHRLVWLYMTGEWPSKQIDHINGNPSDNRWCNLRLATQSQNKANSRVYKSNKSGFKGVSWNKSSKRWNATIQVNKRQIHLGRYHDINDAVAAYRKAAEEHFGSFHRTE
jgi:HNH endonuclease/AP2 domain